MAAQTSQPDGRLRTVLANHNSLKPIETEVPRVPVNSIELRRPIAVIADAPLFNLFRTSLTTAMVTRVGAYYHYGSTGPNSFDCSGFVWSSFQDAGIKFQRGPARSYWAQFQPVSGADKFKFGTLVFFGGLRHVGVVVDEKGFYHASRHHGVIYSPFNDYWVKRIDGFRRVPLDTMQVLSVTAHTIKPVAASTAVEER